MARKRNTGGNNRSKGSQQNRRGQSGAGAQRQMTEGNSPATEAGTGNPPGGTNQREYCNQRDGIDPNDSGREGSENASGSFSADWGCPPDDRAERNRSRAEWIKITELAVIIILLLLILVAVWNERAHDAGTIRQSFEYEDNALTGSEGTEGVGDGKEISIAVMHDYVVSGKHPNFTVGYPDQNSYEIEISFRDSATGKEKYHTKRIAPGTQIKVPGYEFCENGDNQMDAVISIYRPKAQEPVSDSTTMRLNVTKE